MNMQRTQIYLTDEEQVAIRQISIRSGTSQSALIRKAIDQYIAQNTTSTNINRPINSRMLW
jgi:metal-responsive CopG/Arc/MetJ family transcriptional regulator